MMKCGKSFSFLIMVFVLLIGQGSAQAASAAEINAGVNETLGLFYRQVPGSRELVSRAVGVLVFPTVIKAGMGFGGEYGEGAMRVGGKTTGFYNTISASFGFQLGAEARSVIIMFMTPEALSNFHRVDGFKIGVDGSVAIITIGAGGLASSSILRDLCRRKLSASARHLREQFSSWAKLRALFSRGSSQSSPPSPKRTFLPARQD
jgi:lipid-binding SYLF domain-containing protein